MSFEISTNIIEDKIDAIADNLRNLYWSRVLIGLCLGVIPLLLESGYFLSNGYPYHGDSISNLFPAWHIRHAITSGALPIYTELWYGGEYIPFNPLFKGFYPPVWPLYVPGVPMIPAIKAILAMHYVATPAVAYVFLRRDFDWWIAAPFALAFTVPLGFLNGHYEKVFAWPWFVLLLCQLAALTRSEANDHRHGLIAGVAIGMILLAGGNYYAFYAMALIAPIALSIRSLKFVRGAALGGVVGVPKVVVSILPVMLWGSERPRGGKSQTIQEAIAGLVGFWPDITTGALEMQGVFNQAGIAAIGLPLCLTAATTVVVAYVFPQWLSKRERYALIGMVAAGGGGLLLVSKWPYLYHLPVVEIFRAAARALIVTAGATLLVAWIGLRKAIASGHWVLTAIVALVVVTSPVAGMMIWHDISPGSTRHTTVGIDIASDIAASGSESVWIEGQTQGIRTPMQKPIAYELQKRGVALQAVNYGEIGQRYQTHTADGERTFDVLLVGVKLPQNDSQYALTGGWGSPVKGHINTSAFVLSRTVQTADGPLYIYTPSVG